jgi:hypothetical protein
MSAARKDLLSRAHQLCQFIQDAEEEEVWIVDQHRICIGLVDANEQPAILQLLRAHKVCTH